MRGCWVALGWGLRWVGAVSLGEGDVLGVAFVALAAFDSLWPVACGAVVGNLVGGVVVHVCNHSSYRW